MTVPQRGMQGILWAALASMPPAFAAGIPAVDLGEVVVQATRVQLIGDVLSASQGTALAEQLEHRPTLRPGDVLEVIPGLVVTQHSGDGKANQYFLRGFNLDHGTDFATRVDGMPVNMPTHAHGQGYSDLNFLIPELVDRIEYRKGTYYPEEGDFSAAGAADVRYRRRLDSPFVTVSGGQAGFRRGVAGASPAVAGGDLLIAGEYSHNDGPWVLMEGYRTVGGLVKYSHGDAEHGYSVEALGYDAHWHSTDQIPLRAVQSGEISRFGAIDPTDGGRTHRYSLSGEWWGKAGPGQLRAIVYGIGYQLDLTSNFTYDTDPVHGDQFEQYDQRRVGGGSLAYGQPLSLLGVDGELHAGVQVRSDNISPVGLYRSQHAVRYATVRQDQARQTSVGAYLSDSVHWAPWFRTDLGVRADHFDFRVASSLALNSGTARDSIASPKLTLAFGPWAKTEYFLNLGRGFHSNDARGTTITVDPHDGVAPVDRVNPLVRALGGEIGFRSAAIPHLQLAGSLWTLKLDSELLFSGDGGATEPGRASRRSGIELGLFYSPVDWIVIDADLAWTHARFTDPGPVGDRIPNAVEGVASMGVTLNRETGWFGGTRFRYLGPAPLIDDNSVRAAATFIVNIEGGYHFSKGLSAVVTVFNALDRKDNDITYYYASQLQGEPAPVGDIHFHPVEPRTVRAALTLRF
jgi:hypothetical protein